MSDVDLGPELPQTGLIEHPSESNRAVSLRALKRYIEGLSAGASPSAAATAAGTSLDEMRRGGKRVREKLAELTEGYLADVSTIKALVQAAWLEIAIDNPDVKLKLVAMHELAAIPGVQLKQVPGRPPMVEQELSAETMAALEAER